MLVGKVKSIVEEDVTFKELRYAKHIFEQGKKEESKEIITKLMNDTNTDLAEQAHYLNLKWFLTPEDNDPHFLEKCQSYLKEFDKFKIYYQSSKYINSLDKNAKIFEKKI
ncbi:MAG: hypothetical protein R6V47_06185 [Candidatus Delongbacteria bacterium]